MYLGFKQLSFETVRAYYEDGEIGRCLMIYDDDTDAMIDPDISWEEIESFADKGGRFAIELPEKEICLPDGNKATVPEYIDISAKGSLDNERETLREAIRAYLERFGVKAGDVNEDLLLHTENAIVDKLESYGASFVKSASNGTCGEINVVVTTDMEVENVVAVKSNDLGKFLLAVDRAKADYYGGDMEFDTDFTTVLGEYLQKRDIEHRFVPYTTN